MRLMVVAIRVVSALGSPHTQISDPSGCTPFGANAGSFSGTSSSWSSTSALRIARQSVGSAADVASGVGVALGAGDSAVALGEALGAAALAGLLDDGVGVPVAQAVSVVNTRRADAAAPAIVISRATCRL
ncbi:hypothetical protein Microterr_03520 [Microbacterium terricola]|uniref:Secreted protein n=1 Tax=Microbacterium terricola TaxID=344163 RepID=A0ABM8DVP6_9MICO|nr:hypothetical protein Microterr_03520 [Microbacterium terricola]